jgi:hypothetical protein
VRGVVEKLKSPRKEKAEWKRWAVRGGIAAVILLTAGSAMLIESRSPDYGTAPRVAQPRPAVKSSAPATPPVATPAPGAGSPTISTENGAVDSTATADSTRASAASAAARVTQDSSNGAVAVDDSAARARRALVRRDSVQRAVARDSAERASERRAAERESARRDSIRREAAERASASAPNTGTGRSAPAVEAVREAPALRPAQQTTRRDDQDLMMLSDSLAKAATPAPVVTPSGPGAGATGPR